MNILVADVIPRWALAHLERLGHDCRYLPTTSSGDLPELLAAGAEVLVVRGTPVDAAALRAAGNLRLVLRAGSGTDTIDVAEATRRGVIVANMPGRNAAAVAELTIGLLLALDRGIPDAVADLRAGSWTRSRYLSSRGISGRRVGIVGLGEIGLAVAERLAALGCEIRAVARARPASVEDRASRAGVRYLPDLDELAAEVDVLSFHIPLTPQTAGIVGDPLLRAVRPGAILLNTSRGGLIDEAALLQAIEEKQLLVGLDVFPSEPATDTDVWHSELMAHPRVYGTPHVGAVTEQALHSIGQGVVEAVEAYARGTVLQRVNDRSPHGSTGPRSGGTR